MNVIPPIAITDALLTSSTVVETAPAAYDGGTTYSAGDTASVAGAAGLLTVYESLQDDNAGKDPTSYPDMWLDIGETYQVYAGATTYALGDTVIDPSAHLVYESLAAGNIGNALTDATKWLEIGPTNKWAMFDLLRDTRSVAPSAITVTLTPGKRVTSIALLGVRCSSATITMTSDAVEVYSYTETFITRKSFGWFDFFFKPFIQRTNLALFDLPPYSNCVITVEMSATTGNVECGALVVGYHVNIGRVQAEAISDVLNFSSVTRDFAGGTNLMVQRRNVPKTEQILLLDKNRVNIVRALRDTLNAMPAVWSGLDDHNDDYFDALLILGFYKQFGINLKHPEHAIINLELEEI